MTMKKKLSRRDMVAGMTSAAPLLVSDPFRVAFNALVSGFVESSYAQSMPSSYEPANFLHTHFTGGVARWYWDLFLKPYNYADSGPDIVAHPRISTRFVDVPEGQPYTTHNYQFYQHTLADGTLLNCPWLWGQPIPVVGGTTVPMHSLLNNFFSLRGFLMPSDGHSNNFPKTSRPDGAAFSLCGAVSDKVYQQKLSKLVPALTLSYGAVGTFKSKRGAGVPMVPALDMGYADPTNVMAGVFDAFATPHAEVIFGDLFQRREAMNTAISAAMDALGVYSKTIHGPKAEALFSMRHAADQAIRQGLNGIIEEYPVVFQKYYALCQRALDARLVGIDDKPVLNNGSNHIFGFGSQTAIAFNDLNEAFHNATIRINYIAEAFAVAEILFVRGHSKVVTHWFPETVLGRIRYNAQGNTANWVTDEHFTRGATSILGGKAIFTSYAACLNEFKRVMISNNLWNDTVVYCSSELGRRPQAGEGYNSAHSLSNSMSVFSGRIDGPVIIGNIRTGSAWDGNPAATPGTVADASQINFHGVRFLTNADAVNTVAKIVGVDGPAGDNFTSLIGVDSDGKYRASTSLIGLGKNVA